MATIVEALDLVGAKNWWKEWQNPAWKQFVLSGHKVLLKNPSKLAEQSFGKVPAFAFLEGDLPWISGKSATQETEATDA
jgi:hypothetical protein